MTNLTQKWLGRLIVIFVVFLFGVNLGIALATCVFDLVCTL